MTEQLVSLDDAALEDVNGGLSLGLSVNDKTLVGGSLNLTSTGVSGSVTLFNHTLSLGIVSPIQISFG
jgi:hypothetical protein